MNQPPKPIGDIAISVQTVDCSPILTFQGIDLDSGKAAKIQIADDTLRIIAEQADADPTELVLVVSLYSMAPPRAD